MANSAKMQPVMRVSVPTLRYQPDSTSGDTHTERPIAIANHASPSSGPSWRCTCDLSRGENDAHDGSRHWLGRESPLRGDWWRRGMPRAGFWAFAGHPSGRHLQRPAIMCHPWFILDCSWQSVFSEARESTTRFKSRQPSGLEFLWVCVLCKAIYKTFMWQAIESRNPSVLGPWSF